MLIGLIVFVVAVVMYLMYAYNALVRLKVTCDNAWSDIDVQLKRRYDLIPNLVETVKGYATHERETLEKVIQARNMAMNAQGVAQQAQAENVLSGAHAAEVRAVLPEDGALVANRFNSILGRRCL